jgi:SAM-dependent methyltransferase
MQTPFKDHFSGHAPAYSSHRPHYPQALFRFLAAAAPARESAWDCGCGNGQAALGLAALFDQVWATDASAQQIAVATPHPRVTYRTAQAEASGLASISTEVSSANIQNRRDPVGQHRPEW